MLIFLYGDELFNQIKRLNELKVKFVADVDPEGLNIVELEGEKLTLPKLSDAAGAVSMFARKRFIVIRNLFNSKAEVEFKKLDEYLRKIAGGDHIIVLVDQLSVKEAAKLPKYKKGLYDFCADQKFSVCFPKLKSAELINWIRQEVKTSGGDITNDAVIVLLELVSSDMLQLSHELDKLRHYKLGITNEENGLYKIESADVKLVVRGQYIEHIFALTDALSERKRGRVIKLLEEELLAGQEADSVFYMVLRQIRSLLIVRDGIERGMSEADLASALKIQSFIVRKLMGQARNFNVETLKVIFAQLIKLEYQFKSGQMDLLTGLGSILSRI